PCLPRLNAMARPIPRVAPVTKATLPCRLIIILLTLLEFSAMSPNHIPVNPAKSYRYVYSNPPEPHLVHIQQVCLHPVQQAIQLFQPNVLGYIAVGPIIDGFHLG